MRKLAAALGVTALAAGLVFTGAGSAFADDDHSVRDDHSAPTCQPEHQIALVNATCVAHIVDVGDIHIN